MTTYRLGLLGYPLAHSLSPRLHMAALEHMQLEGRYDLFPFPPGEAGVKGIQGLIAQLREGELHGLNVTVPHKMALLPYLDELTPTAQAIGAVNALRLQAGKVLGDNFDYPAFIQDLTQQLTQVGAAGLLGRPNLPGRTALVLGAGGSARAVVYGLLSQGWQVLLASRRLEQAQQLARAFPMFPTARSCGLNALPGFDLAGLNLVVNTTPLGMFPEIGSSAWPAGLPFPSAAFVYDLVYSPPETAWLRSARMAGLRTANGLGMLVKQAAMSFHSWTGLEPPLEAMYRSVSPVYLQNKPANPSTLP